MRYVLVCSFIATLIWAFTLTWHESMHGKLQNILTPAHYTHSWYLDYT
jgi:hypothetical protein